MNPEIAAQLAAPFDDKSIGKLPRVTCGACSRAKGVGHCEKHQRAKCSICQAYVSTQHIHIDYVGHADVTHRLLTVDPEWTWEPVGTDERGLPALDLGADGEPVGLWILLTVAGMTRLGYGSCPSGQGDAVKVLIGDALRNAALRFGVAWDLWAKGDRSDPSGENATGNAATAKRATKPPTAPASEPPPVSGVTALRVDIAKAARALEPPMDIEAINADFHQWSRGKAVGEADEATLRDYLAHLRKQGGSP